MNGTGLFLLDERQHVFQVSPLTVQRTMTFVFSVNAFLPVCLSGSYTVRWRDPVRSAATCLPASLPPSGETQDRPHPLHD